MTQLKRHARGQSLVEGALGGLVFVTVLMFGVHFAETGFVALKVTEAANFALFRSTQYNQAGVGAITSVPVAHYAPDKWGLTGSIIPSRNEANTRYANFNGQANFVGTATSSSQLFTHAQNMQVTCTLENVDWGPGMLTATSNMNRTSAIGCGARAEVQVINMPQVFYDTGQKFFTKSLASFPLAVPVCAFGLPVNGQCPGRAALMLDDWGLRGPVESTTCGLNGCTNQGYQGLAQAAYTQGGGGAWTAGTQLLASVGVSDPSLGEGKFWMSFVDSQGYCSSPTCAFQDKLPGGSHLGPANAVWPTTPWSAPNSSSAPQSSFNSRTKCFLGLQC